MSSTILPEPATEPDEIERDDWESQVEYPAHLVGVVHDRRSVDFRKPRGERESFEILEVKDVDGNLHEFLGGRTNAARLIEQHDPHPGDGIAISAFGKNRSGAYQYAIRVERVS